MDLAQACEFIKSLRLHLLALSAAYVVDNTKKSLREYPELKAADEYAFGSGHVKPVSALDPGLAYDTDPLDYLDFLCAFENATILNAVFRAIEGKKIPSKLM